VAARKLTGETLIWTGTDVWRLSYVGAPLYHGVSLAGRDCGLFGPNAVAITRPDAWWMNLAASSVQRIRAAAQV
jgi:hypothetical protein